MLNFEVEKILNNLGAEGLQKVIDMGLTEMFRNYCMHEFNWFKGSTKPHSDRHRREKTWMRFYTDHGRLPYNLHLSQIINKTLTEAQAEVILDEISTDYKNEYNFDILNPDPNLKIKRLKLSYL